MITKTVTPENTIFRFILGTDYIRILVYSPLSDGTRPGSIESNLKSEENDSNFNNMIDGMESMLLALACEGFDLSGKAGHDAVVSALNAITSRTE